MIYIIGKVTYIGQNYIYLESNFIGRKIFIKENEKIIFGKTMKFFTTEIVVETSKGQSFSQIYGFLSFNEFALFNRLITLPSIGPKTALNVLSNDSDLLLKYIINRNYEALINMKGISEKIAKVIINNLGDVYEDKNSIEKQNINNQKQDVQSDEEKYIEIIESLKALGYTKNEIEYGISKLDESKYKDFVIEDILADIIKNIATRKVN